MFIIAGIIVSILIVILAIVVNLLSGSNEGRYASGVRGRLNADEEEIRRAGRAGENVAQSYIKNVLRNGDIHLTNIQLKVDGRPTELDNVVINNYGIFIIEVKNYSGHLEGDEDDFEWDKYHISKGSNVYAKKVKNPIPQVKRQIDILSRYLKYNGFNAWIEGYIIFVQNNCPINSPYVLYNYTDLDRAIHTPTKVKLSNRDVKFISESLVYNNTSNNYM